MNREKAKVTKTGHWGKTTEQREKEYQNGGALKFIMGFDYGSYRNNDPDAFAKMYHSTIDFAENVICYLVANNPPKAEEVEILNHFKKVLAKVPHDAKTVLHEHRVEMSEAGRDEIIRIEDISRDEDGNPNEEFIEILQAKFDLYGPPGAHDDVEYF